MNVFLDADTFRKQAPENQMVGGDGLSEKGREGEITEASFI